MSIVDSLYKKSGCDDSTISSGCARNLHEQGLQVDKELQVTIPLEVVMPGVTPESILGPPFACMLCSAFDQRQCCLLLIIPFWSPSAGTSKSALSQEEPRTLITLKCLDTSVLNTGKNHLITLLTDFCHFLNVTIEDVNVVPQSL
jgi:hypothetical protein